MKTTHPSRITSIIIYLYLSIHPSNAATINPTLVTSRKGGKLVIIPGLGTGGCPIGPRPPSAAAAPGVTGGVLPGGTVTGGRWTMCTSRGPGDDWAYP